MASVERSVADAPAGGVILNCVKTFCAVTPAGSDVGEKVVNGRFRSAVAAPLRPLPEISVAPGKPDISCVAVLKNDVLLVLMLPSGVAIALPTEPRPLSSVIKLLVRNTPPTVWVRGVYEVAGVATVFKIVPLKLSVWLISPSANATLGTKSSDARRNAPLLTPAMLMIADVKAEFRFAPFR